jgi:hypothetical protein
LSPLFALSVGTEIEAVAMDKPISALIIRVSVAREYVLFDSVSSVMLKFFSMKMSHVALFFQLLART